MTFDFDPISFAVGFSHGKRLAALKKAAADYDREQATKQAETGDILEDTVQSQDTAEQGQIASNNNT